MNRKLLIIPLLFLLFLGLFIFRIFSYPSNKKLNLYKEIISTRLDCELKIGSKKFDDYYVKNRTLCYSEKAINGDIKACYQAYSTSECLVSTSLKTETILCDRLDEDSKSKCLKNLFDYYPEKAISFKRFSELSTLETVKLKDKERFKLVKDEVILNVNGNLMKEDRQCITSNGQLKCKIKGYSLFSCSDNDKPRKLTGKGANHKLGEPILFITGCNTLSNDEIEVSVLKFQIELITF